ncbi:jacalin-related lectin 3-like [Cornus florida]|uniref:jacalin-related lectin 3-like n=1 Tax=Cornus florida TaxID=4283 RepID=UPI0028A1F0A0|nr:jacalin-related lectin 3-like [Cornus florida]
MADEQEVTFGPHGGEEGQSWDDGTHNTIRELIIYSLSAVRTIQVVYDDGEGNPITGKKHGRDCEEPNRVKLNYPTEYLVSISGYTGSYLNTHVVKSITLQSNIRQYGPYGEEEGTHFSNPSTSGKIVGFFGRQGDVVNSIGVYIKPIPIQTTIPSVGPFGNATGQKWDDGTYNTIRGISIQSGWLIDSIQVIYNDIEGNAVSGKKHGSDSGQQNTVKLDYPGEFLLSVWGYYGQVNKMVVIRSLGFQSNKKTYGPFGMEDGEKFEFRSDTSGKIIGFHGRSDKYLTAIGAYYDK